MCIKQSETQTNLKEKHIRSIFSEDGHLEIIFVEPLWSAFDGRLLQSTWSKCFRRRILNIQSSVKFALFASVKMSGYQVICIVQIVFMRIIGWLFPELVALFDTLPSDWLRLNDSDILGGDSQQVPSLSEMLLSELLPSSCSISCSISCLSTNRFWQTSGLLARLLQPLVVEPFRNLQTDHRPVANDSQRIIRWSVKDFWWVA